MQLISTGTIEHSRRSRPGLLERVHPVLVGVPAQDFLELRHQLPVPEERPRFSHEPRRVDDVLREQVHQLQELVICLAIIQGALDTIEEVGLVIDVVGTRLLNGHGLYRGRKGDCLLVMWIERLGWRLWRCAER